MVMKCALRLGESAGRPSLDPADFRNVFAVPIGNLEKSFQNNATYGDTRKFHHSNCVRK